MNAALPVPVRRVLVAIDASPHSLAALEAAVALAAARGWPLLALFVEDLRLLRATGLPFAQEVGSWSGALRPLAAAEAERNLRRQAEEAHAAVERVARRAAVSWSFEIRRGTVVSEILAAVERGDLLTVGAAGWSRLRQHRLGDTADSLLRRAPAPLLVIRHGVRLRPPLLAWLDGPDWLAVLTLAGALAGPDASDLVVAVTVAAQGQAGAAPHLPEVKKHLASMGRAGTRVRALAGAGPAALRAAVRRERAGAVLLGAGAAALGRDDTGALLGDLAVPLVVARVSAAERAPRPA